MGYDVSLLFVLFIHFMLSVCVYMINEPFIFGPLLMYNMFVLQHKRVPRVHELDEVKDQYLHATLFRGCPLRLNTPNHSAQRRFPSSL